MIDDKEKKLQAHRRAMAGLVLRNASVQSLVLLLFAAVGTISWLAAAAFAVASVGTAAVFLALFRGGLNLRLRVRDKSLLVPQLLVCAAIQLVFVVVTPQLAVLFLLVLIVLFGYAAVQFTPRQFMWGWLAYGLSSGAAVWFVGDRFAYPGTSGAETFLVWLFFFIAVRRLTLASAQYSSLREKLSEKNRQLQASLKRIEELASHDDLTGAYNRRSFLGLLDEELKRAERSGAPFCVAILDLDHFKSINDQHGHPVGDAVLQDLCEIAGRSLRSTDRLGRVGGEEFGVLLPATTCSEGVEALERLRSAVHEHGWSAVAAGLRVSFSAGLVTWQPDDTSSAMVRRADQALYCAKHLGRNRVVADSGPAG